ncbi:unnamed protein product, partial [marine sediment metagenome]
MLKSEIMRDKTENVANLVAYGIKCCEKNNVEYADVKFM